MESEISIAQRRAACEGLGLLARTGNDIFTARMVRLLIIVLLLISASIIFICFVDFEVSYKNTNNFLHTCEAMQICMIQAPSFWQSACNINAWL